MVTLHANPIGDIFTFLYTLLLYILVYYGNGSLILKAIRLKMDIRLLYFCISICVGMTLIALTIWSFATQGILNDVFAILFLVTGLFGCSLSLRESGSLSRLKQVIREFSVFEILLVFYVLPIIFTNATTPFTDWDALANWDHWARQWAQRDDMSGYSFGLYFQFVPIVNSVIYRLTDTAYSILPATTYAIHSIWGFLGLLFALLIYRLGCYLWGDTFLGRLLAFSVTFVIFQITEIRVTFWNGRAEAFCVFFLLTFIFAVTFNPPTDDDRPVIDYRKLFLIAILGAGASWVKLSNTPWVLTFIVVSTFFPRDYLIGKESRSVLSIFSYNFKKRALAAIIGISIAMIPVGMHYLQQHDMWNTLTENYSLNHSPWVSSSYEGIGLFRDAHNHIKHKYSWIDSEWKSYIGMMLEFFEFSVFKDAQRVSLFLKITALSMSVLFLICNLTSSWRASLLLILGISQWQWWERLSYAQYNNLSNLLILTILVMSGIAFLGRLLARISPANVSLAGWSRYAMITPIIGLIIYGANAKILPRLVEFYKEPQTFFIFQDSFQRADSAFPQAGQVLKAVYPFIKDHVVPGDWKKKLVASDVLVDRFIPHSFTSQWLILRPDENRLAKKQEIRPEHYIIVSKSPIIKTQQGVQVGPYWIELSPYLSSSYYARTKTEQPR